jgi:magnesium transporter
MLSIFYHTPAGIRLSALGAAQKLDPNEDRPVWVDVLQPTAEDTLFIEQNLGIELPTREEMLEIEASSRLYSEEDALYMTVAALAKVDSAHPETIPITFILVDGCLVTLRYLDPLPFRTYQATAERNPNLSVSGEAILIGLMEAIIDRTADILERIAADVDSLSRKVFDPPQDTEAARDFRAILRQVGREGGLISKVRESLVSIGRLLTFFSQALAAQAGGKTLKDLKNRIKTLSRDVLSLSDHASFLAGKVNFLLDATLGMINIEQNSIIKIFSVAAVVFLPPTLVASLYGMNFSVMPELDWKFGYPFAIFMMIISALLPYLYFKRKRWL